jgi:ribosomal RNA methyltransferase Nop2
VTRTTDEEGGPSEPVKILTPEEREVEKKAGGPDVLTVQRRLRHCVRVLQNFKKLGKGRCDTHVRGLVMSLIARSSYPGGEPTTYLS